MSSFKVEVLAYGEIEYASNGLRFASVEQAEAYAVDLAWRWTAVEQWRVVPAEEEPNHDGTNHLAAKGKEVD